MGVGSEPRHKITVTPVTVRMIDPRLEVQKRRTVGFRCVCSCGYIGRLHRDIGVARAEGRVHDYEPSTPTDAGGMP